MSSKAIEELEQRIAELQRQLDIYDSGGFADADALAAKFIETTARLAELESERDKWKRRAERFREGYREAQGEVLGLQIHEMQLQADGNASETIRREAANAKTKMLAVCIERNEARARLAALEASKPANNRGSCALCHRDLSDQARLYMCRRCFEASKPAPITDLAEAVGVLNEKKWRGQQWRIIRNSNHQAWCIKGQVDRILLLDALAIANWIRLCL